MPQSNDFIATLKQDLNGRPGQPMLFGVCRTLATRFGSEPWALRLGAIVLALFWTWPALVAYILLGLLMPETAARSRGVFIGLFITLREWLERGLDLFGGTNSGKRQDRVA